MKFVVFVSVLAVCSTAQDYCSLCQSHTACSYKGPSKKCGNERRSGLMPGDIPIIVREHNLFRSKIALGEEKAGKPGPQPSASNMSALSWDPELATIAQFWADQCHFGHDKCRNVRRFFVGQNVFMSMGSEVEYESEWPKAISAWYYEVANFSSKKISPFGYDDEIGHYTQMVWDTTYKIGCGLTMYKDTQKKRFNRYYVCNYGPGGNLIGATMYKTGKPCSDCPNRCNAGLCENQIEPYFSASILGIPQPTPPGAPVAQQPIPDGLPALNLPVFQQPPAYFQQPIPEYYYPYLHWNQHYYWPYQSWK